MFEANLVLQLANQTNNSAFALEYLSPASSHSLFSYIRHVIERNFTFLKAEH